MMTPKERWIAALQRKPFDRIPCDFWATGEVVQSLLREFQCRNEDELWKELHIDRPHSVGPSYIGPQFSGRDIWQVSHKAQEVAEGQGIYMEVDECPLAGMTDVKQLEDFPWPTTDWFDFSNIPEALDRLEQWPVCGATYEPFLIYCSMRGLEQAYQDLAIFPEFAEFVLQKIFEFHYDLNQKIFEAAGSEGKILFCYVAEDLGSQHGLLMSIASIERFLIPRMKAMIDLAHSYGVLAFHHDDGAIRAILPRLIEIGIDILNPIQWRCPGMDREALKRDFGEAVTFHGAVDNQYTLPFGTPEEVRQEVIDNIRILGEGGGYIVAPCHNIQPITPIGNIMALYAAIDEVYG